LLKQSYGRERFLDNPNANEWSDDYAIFRLPQGSAIWPRKSLGSESFPAKEEMDASHLAIATIHEMDFLLTWNYAHLANPVVQAGLIKLWESADLVATLMVSPESIPQVRFGQSIRREK
jgi:hypothetical protein